MSAPDRPDPDRPAPGDIAIERFADGAAFLAAAGTFLTAREAEHNLILGIAAALIADPGRPTGPPFLALARRLAEAGGGSVVGAAVMTPPFNLVMSCLDDAAAADAFGVDLDRGRRRLPGVTGPVETARRFAEAWTARHGLAAQRTMSERIYRVERVRPPTGVPGHLRLATTADRDLLIEYVGDFLREALGRTDPAEVTSVVDRGMATGTRTFYLWDDGRPVSLVATAGPTPNGIRIGPVYTPPADRGHGYASAATAAVTQAEFDAGRRFVYLFTDIANPTSNKIYQAIGYEPVIDIDQWSFDSLD
jgi:predicted GNAT family acetyltransferase